MRQIKEIRLFIYLYIYKERGRVGGKEMLETERLKLPYKLIFSCD